MSVKIVIDLPPQSKGRPRFTKSGHAYTPQKTRDYEMAVSTFARNAIKSPLNGEIQLIINYYMPIPKSWRESKKQLADDGAIRPTTKPDIDNLTKAVLDSLNGIAYFDDKQIVDLHCRKFYSDNPRTEIQVEEI